MHEVLIIGAGVAGLACARRLTQAGLDPVVLERSPRVGGRCATRHLPDGQPVDHGLLFLHGSDPQFLHELAAVPEPSMAWPAEVRGSGLPCQPEAFAPQESRLAYAGGVNAFPRYLASDLEVRYQQRVEHTEVDSQGWRVHLEAGDELRARTLICAMPVEQSRRLLPPLSAPPPLAAAGELLRGVGSIPSFSLIATYPPSRSVDWQVWYPDDCKILQALCHDSSKRASPRHTVLVLQSRAAWTRTQLDNGEDLFATGRSMLHAAARLVGPWVEAPDTVLVHRWRYGRPARGSEFAAPLFMTPHPNVHLGLTGDVFAPGAGVEAAWRAGSQLAQRVFERLP